MAACNKFNGLCLKNVENRVQLSKIRLGFGAVICFSIICGASLISSQHNKITPNDSLKVLTYNINNISKTVLLKDVANIIKKTGRPDIILLQEVSGADTARFLADKLSLQYFRYRNYRGKSSGLAILSRFPLKNPKWHYFKYSPNGYFALVSEIQFKQYRLVLCSLHLERNKAVRRHREISSLSAFRLMATELFGDTSRNRSVKELVQWLSNFRSYHVILGGDFNTFPLSKPIRFLSSKYKDALWPTSSYFASTYKEIGYPFKPRIDFLFHSQAVKCQQAGVIKDGPSDHYPVNGVFSIF